MMLVGCSGYHHGYVAHLVVELDIRLGNVARGDD